MPARSRPFSPGGFDPALGAIRASLCAVLWGLVAGCAGYTVSSNLSPWVGRDFSAVTLAHGTPSAVRRLPDNTTENRYVSNQGRCVTTWIVDSRNTILAWNHTGECVGTP